MTEKILLHLALVGYQCSMCVLSKFVCLDCDRVWKLGLEPNFILAPSNKDRETTNIGLDSSVGRAPEL